MGSSQRSVISLTMISKSFIVNRALIPVIADLSLSVGFSEVVAIIGPSGVGKTTLLNIIAGEVAPQSGEICWDDCPSSKDEARPKSSMIFQDDTVFPWMRVIDNVAFSIESKAATRKKDARRLAQRFLEELGLGDYAGFWPKDLSGGMKKRVELARALFSNPKLILLDEPFSMLDSITRSEVHNWFEAQISSRRLAAVLVTHDIREAISVSDRVLVMKGRPAKIAYEARGMRGKGSSPSDLDRLELDLETNIKTETAP